MFKITEMTFKGHSRSPVGLGDHWGHQVVLS